MDSKSIREGNLMATQKQISIAARLDCEVKRLERGGANEIAVFVGMTEHLPLFYELLHAGTDFDKLCERYDGFYRFAKTMEMIAEGIHSGEIEVPRDEDIPDWNKKDNVRTLLPRIIINRLFLEDFMDEDAPCFAMGILEKRTKKSAFLALRTLDPIPHDVTQVGFNFGHTVIGNKDFEVVHFVFTFYGFKTFNALVNPADANTREVLKLMMDKNEYFFFAINPGGSVTAFKTGMSDVSSLSGIMLHEERIKKSKTTPQQYDKAVTTFSRNPDPSGVMLDWVCYDKPEYLNLSGEVIEMTPS